VALDPSPASRAAAIRAGSLVVETGQLHLIHVVDSAIETSAPRHATPEAMRLYRDQKKREASALLEEVAADLRRRHPQIGVSVEAGFGRPVDEALAAAARTEADLVAVGAHGKGVFGRLLLGSFTEEISRRSLVPVLVVREIPQESARVDRVLVAVDLEPSSRQAAHVAEALARQLARPLEAVHVIDARKLPLPMTGPSDAALASRDTRQAIELAPAAVESFLSSCGLTLPSFRVLIGTPAEEIVQASSPTDLIVCGTHGRGFLGRVAFGSVALHLLRHAPCPVIVVHPKARPES
jgi:nucleotide-binding universal stress UspA family protein